jgi:hypothetical protein
LVSNYSRSLRDAIVRQWLYGKRRDIIAIESGLSTGTVSNVIRDWREEIGSMKADEVREFGVILRKTGMTPLQCAKGFRMLNILHELGFMEDGVEQFLRNTYKVCNNIGLQPDKIALHINELVGLTHKVPLDEVSNHINRNRSMVEESNQELEMVSTQLEEARTNLDNIFSRYNVDRTEARWAYWLKREIEQRGLEFNRVIGLVNTIEDFYALGFDARKIISKVSEIQDLETRANTLKSEISKLQKAKENESRQLVMLKQFSSTHIQASYLYTKLESMGLGLRELTILYNTIVEIAKENDFSESTAVIKFMDDVSRNYTLVRGFEARLEELKDETEDTEAGLTLLRQSESEIDNAISSLRTLWAKGITSNDIPNQVKSIDKETTNNNTDQENKTINDDNLQLDLKKYHNLKTAIENLNKDKNELIGEISSLMSTRDWLATSLVQLTCRVIHYFDFISRVIKCMRIHVQVQILHSYITFHTAYCKTQELSIDKLSISSNSNQKFLPLIKSTSGNDTKFNKLKQTFIGAIRNGPDKLKSGKRQNKGDSNSITAKNAALNHEKLTLEHANDNSLSSN